MNTAAWFFQACFWGRNSSHPAHNWGQRNLEATEVWHTEKSLYSKVSCLALVPADIEEEQEWGPDPSAEEAGLQRDQDC